MCSFSSASSALPQLLTPSLLLLLILLILIPSQVNCLNVDTRYPVIFRYPSRNGGSFSSLSPHFGHSVLAFKNGADQSPDSTMYIICSLSSPNQLISPPPFSPVSSSVRPMRAASSEMIAAPCTAASGERNRTERAATECRSTLVRRGKYPAINPLQSNPFPPFPDYRSGPTTGMHLGSNLLVQPQKSTTTSSNTSPNYISCAFARSSQHNIFRPSLNRYEMNYNPNGACYQLAVDRKRPLATLMPADDGSKGKSKIE